MLFLQERLSEHKSLCISELSEETVANQPWYCEASGLYLYLVDDRPGIGDIAVLASVPSFDAAYEFFDSVVPGLRL